VIFNFGLILSSFAVEGEVMQYPSIKDSIQISSSPKGLEPFSPKQLSDVLKSWSHVQRKSFYYELIEGFPFQEGTLTFEDGVIAKWRYYYCGGFRIEMPNQEPRFLLPKSKKINKVE